jgi:hypothetical protein
MTLIMKHRQNSIMFPVNTLTKYRVRRDRPNNLNTHCLRQFYSRKDFILLMIGKPYLHLSVARGTAFDIVGQGIASHEMMLMAMKLAGSLKADRGFL